MDLPFVFSCSAADTVPRTEDTGFFGETAWASPGVQGPVGSTIATRVTISPTMDASPAPALSETAHLLLVVADMGTGQISTRRPLIPVHARSLTILTKATLANTILATSPSNGIS